MKVLINAMRTGVGAQGNAVYTRELVRGLSRTRGIDLAVIVPRDQAGIWRRVAGAGRVHEVDLLPHPVGLIAERTAVKRLVRAEKASVYHSPNTLLPLWRPACATLATIHDLSFKTLPQGAVKRLYKELVYGYTARRADALLAISQHTADTLTHHYPEAAGRVHVIRLGQPYCGDDRMPDETRHQRQVEGQEKYLLTFAHQRHKNAEGALRVLRLVRESYPSMRLKIIGAKTPSARRLESLTRELGLSAFVDMLGFVSEQELARLYREAVALVFLSRYEGFGLPALEAMALGCPVVASDCAALPEVVSGHGCVVGPDSWGEAADYVLTLISNAEQTQSVRVRARKYAAQWPWHRTVLETVEVYHRLARVAGALGSPHRQDRDPGFDDRVEKDAFKGDEHNESPGARGAGRAATPV